MTSSATRCLKAMPAACSRAWTRRSRPKASKRPGSTVGGRPCGRILQSRGPLFGRRGGLQKGKEMYELGVVYRKITRADREVTDQLAALGSATVHEAMGRSSFIAGLVADSC